ncbi:MAG: ComF family protein [Deltaproteobacteria bacterium]|nr:ComF family protein [Deltaproteobacteria bacterium]
MRNWISLIWQATWDTLLPPRCLGCDATRSPENWEEMPPLSRLFCDPCQPTIEGAEPVVPLGPLARLHVPYAYGGQLAEAIMTFKYHDRAEMAWPLASLWHPLRAQLRGFDLVVPVPLHRQRLRRRGYNQAALLARALRLGPPVATHLLLRKRSTPPQATLSASERRSALQGAFDTRRPLGGRVLLVDDVTTTGATLATCAQALLHAGAERVEGIALAHTQR